MLCWWKLLQLSSSSCDSFQQPRICPRSTGYFCQRLYSGYNDQILPLNIFKVFLQRNYFKMFFKMFLNVGDFFFSLAAYGYTPLITWKEFQSCMPWEIAILVGGGFALADGCEVMQFIEDLCNQHDPHQTQFRHAVDSRLFSYFSKLFLQQY